MARTPSNTTRICWTLSLLEVTPQDHILEVGFGPGIAVELLTRIVGTGLVAGVDHSAVMLRQATRRNAEAIRQGKVMLRLGSASDLPRFETRFDKVFTINSIHFWTNPTHCLMDLRRLLRPRGLIGVTIQPRSRGATDASARQIGEEIRDDLQRAGFSNCRLEVRKAAPVAMACALGVNEP
jgi:ubiquinone/menaquinone biosynthesis C-methylase UbiE